MEYKIKIPKIPNMGDLLNKEMLETLEEADLKGITLG